MHWQSLDPAGRCGNLRDEVWLPIGMLRLVYVNKSKVTYKKKESKVMGKYYQPYFSQKIYINNGYFWGLKVLNLLWVVIPFEQTVS